MVTAGGKRASALPPVIATGVGRRALRILSVVVSVAAAIFLVLAIRREAADLGPLLRGLRLLPLLGALLVTLLVSALGIILWREIVAQLGLRLPPGEATAILSLSYLSRYVPGAIWSFAAIGYLGRRREISYRAGAFSLLVALLWQGATAALWVPLVVGLRVTPEVAPAWAWLLIALGGLGALVVLLPASQRRLARPLGLPDTAAPARWSVLASLVGWSASWVLRGLALWLAIAALGTAPPPLPLLVGIGALSWLGGTLGSAAPAGLGLQDAALALLLGAVVPTEVALGAALLARALKIVNDMLYGLLGALLYRRLRLGAAEEVGDGMDDAPAGAS